MNISKPTRSLGVCAAVGLLAGCSSGGSQASTTGVIPLGASHAVFDAIAPDSIVYTPVNEQITDRGTLRLDLNNDGKNDFTFRQYFNQAYQQGGMGPPRLCGAIGSLIVTTSLKGNGVANGAMVGWAAALLYGSTIDSKLSFDKASSLMYGYGVGCVRERGSRGYWNGAQNQYLGLKFKVLGQAHYGWAKVSSGGGLYGDYTTLTGYAYETVAGKSIAAGQTK